MKGGIRIKYEADVLWLLHALAQRDLPVSCSIYRRVGLTRSTMREALGELKTHRAVQVVLRGKIFATRFKYFTAGGPLPTVCQRCGGEDSFGHLAVHRLLFREGEKT